METITISGLKDTEEFKKNKECAWKYIKGEGNFNIDDFEPAQYKYFDKLLQLYGKLHSESITKEQAKAEDEKNYASICASILMGSPVAGIIVHSFMDDNEKSL